MSYLHPSDIFEAGLTCRRWLDASLHPKFATKVFILTLFVNKC